MGAFSFLITVKFNFFYENNQLLDTSIVKSIKTNSFNLQEKITTFVTYQYGYIKPPLILKPSKENILHECHLIIFG
jgi:hypothetical protein